MRDAPARHWVAVRIVVTIASLDPPEGRVTSSRVHEPSAFVGWLGLIRLLADAVESDREAARSDVATDAHGTALGQPTDSVARQRHS